MVPANIATPPRAPYGAPGASVRTMLTLFRATGRAHLGNSLGALRAYVEWSNRADLRCFIGIADLHITRQFDTEGMPTSVRPYSPR